MFVAKNELTNAWKLSWIRMRDVRSSGILALSGVLGVYLLAGLIPAIIMMLRETDGLESYQFTDFSTFIISVFAIALITANCLYRANNQSFAVYPQNNTSRFLSFQMTTHFWAIIVPFCLLLLYLIQYGVTAAIAAGRDNVYFAYGLDAGLLVSGLAVMVVYMAACAGVIALVSTLLRKFRLYAAAFFSALFVLAVANPLQALVVLRVLFGFLIFESSAPLFVLKGLAFWAALLFASIVINKHTVYYKSHRVGLKTGGSVKEGALAIALGLALALIALAVIMLLALPAGTGDSQVQDQEYAISEDDFLVPGHMQFEIDISALPRGSDIDVRVSGDIALIEENGAITIVSFHRGMERVVFEDGSFLDFPREYLIATLGGELLDIQGGTLIVGCSFPRRVVSSMDISHFIRPEFDFRLEGSTLYLSYTYERNMKAVFLPMWSFMWQFEHFRGRGMPSESYFGSTYASGGRLWFWVE